MNKSVAFLAASGLLAGGLGGYFHPTLAPTSPFYSSLLSLFSILAGFLLTAIALIGNGLAIIAGANWRVLQNYQKTFKNRINRLCFLLLLYIVDCMLILFMMTFVADAPVPQWLRYSVNGIACAALWYSLFLPFFIGGVYKEYYRATLRERMRDSE